MRVTDATAEELKRLRDALTMLDVRKNGRQKLLVYDNIIIATRMSNVGEIIVNTIM